MKSYVTRFLKTVAIFYLGFPVFYILVTALLFDIPAQQCLRILLSPSYYLISVLAIAVGYGLWEVKRWGWYLFITTNFLIAWQNAIFVNQYGTSHHKVLAFAASLVFLIVMTVRVAREIRVPYFFPKIRWWESNPRYKLAVSAKMVRKDGSIVEGQILDLSLGGCFIKLRGELDLHEVLNLAFTVFGAPIEAQGVVVWRTQSTVTHPKGIGVKFYPFVRAQKRSMRQIHQRLRKINALYRSSRYLLNQEDFLKRLQELETRPARRKRMTG